MKSERKCPICDSDDVELLHRQNFVLPEKHPLSEGYRVVCCNECGFVFADTTATQSDYDKFYADHSKYNDIKTSTGGGGNPLDERRLMDTAATLAQILPNFNSSILDIGCATGGLLRELSKLGYRALVGIDPSEECVNATKGSPGVTAEVGSLNKIREDIGKFDLVVLSHVLEHVQDTKTAMEIFNRITKPGSMVYIEVPDATRYRDFVIAPFQDFNTEHINHFSLTALQNFFRKGWRTKSSGSKLIKLAEGLFFPSIYFIAEKLDASHEQQLEKDQSLLLSINHYIEVSAKLFSEVNEKLKEILRESESIIVYGTGQLAMKLLRDSCLKDANIELFVDGNPLNHGKKLMGKRICSPVEICGSTAPVLITSLVNCESIREDISQLGITNTIYDLNV